ncbi:MAG TPA: S8 family serine peptidase, partial [Actinomycetota bacterium]|nr:S8 family serine peptidase [Actinomycetota bacterium]
MFKRAKALLVVVALAVPLAAQSALAQFPQKATGSDDSNPYAYQNYMRLPAAQYPPSDLGGDIWKYSSKNACDLYGMISQNCDPLVNANPQELSGVTGASIDKAWESTTGRPDVVIAVTDSGVKWNDLGAMDDLVNKTWLNQGELPVPDWGTPDPAPDALHTHDRNHDGVFNMKDYCPDWHSRNDCGGTGDLAVRGNPATPDTDYNNNGIIDPEDLIFKFSNGIDNDSNGYKDDFVGWDSYEDDNDPFDEVQYGHGTGEARDSTAEINNGGDAGVCPNCMVMHMRVGDSFIADASDFAQGAVYAVDNGASVIQSALGTLNNSSFAQQAIDYAYRRGVVFIASAADESAAHHNQPSVLEHAVTMNSIGEPEIPGARPASYLEFRGCTNFGAYITAAVPSNSCSSEAVGRSSGMAGLAYGAGRNALALGAISDYGNLDGPGKVPAGRALSAEEIHQLIATTADDINFITPVLYTARPSYPETLRYPATAGWDPYFGYGRINAKRIVDAVRLAKIPPEADITSPRWFDTVDPDAGPIAIGGRVASLRSDMYSYSVRWGLWSWRDNNAAPSYSTEGVTLSHVGDQTTQIEGTLATIDPAVIKSALALANGVVGAHSGPAVDPVTGRGDHENRNIPDKFGVVVQLQVVSKDGSG